MKPYKASIGTPVARVLLPFLGMILLSLPLFAEAALLQGYVTDPQGTRLPNATVQLLENHRVLAQATSGSDGRFELRIEFAGKFDLKVEASGFQLITRSITVHAGVNPPIDVRVVGVRIPSYASLSFTYRFGRQANP